jgi:energy-coupling factor transporter ATP-binding protein EcfA2
VLRSLGGGVIRTERLTYFYPDAVAPALEEVSLGVAPGEFLLVAGRSGSGKSSILNSVNGLVPHLFGGRFSGRVRVNGFDTRRASPAQLASQVGTVFQEPAARFVATTVADEIAFGLELLGLPSQTIRHAVEDTIERLDLVRLLDRELNELSGGEQQRVAVAAALARQPEILLLDEPTSQLDRQAAEGVIDWLVDLRARLGVTTVISEHRLARLLPHVTQMAYFADGHLQRAGVPDDVLGGMPYGPPGIMAARHLGLPIDADFRALREVLGSAPYDGPSARRSGASPRLVVSGLSFRFPQIRALEEVSFEVLPGEVLGIVGRNGSGKSTLLRCLMGLLRPSAGDVRLGGVSCLDSSVAERARTMAYLPQWPDAMLFAESVLEELRLTLRNHGMDDPADRHAHDLLAELGLSSATERYPRDLSAGERQRAALAAVAVCRPSILLLDEPTLGIDPLGQERLAALLDGWKQGGMSLLLASHDVEFVARVSDRVLILEDGRVAAVGPAAETLHGHPTYRTELQQLTGRARPATLQDVLSMTRSGGLHADRG